MSLRENKDGITYGEKFLKRKLGDRGKETKQLKGVAYGDG